MKRHSRTGFTLIELLVVMAIIAILAAMVLLALQTAYTKAHLALCMNNLKQIGNALQLYANDWGGWMPSYGKCPDNKNFTNAWIRVDNVTTAMGGWEDYVPWGKRADASGGNPSGSGVDPVLFSWFALTPEYLPNVKTLFCPGGVMLPSNGARYSDHIGLYREKPATNDMARIGIADTYSHIHVSYAYNPGLKVGRFPDSESVVVADQNTPMNTYKVHYTTGNANHYFNRQWNLVNWVTGNPYFWIGNNYTVLNHGAGGAQYLYMDGHVALIRNTRHAAGTNYTTLYDANNVVPGWYSLLTP